MVTEKSVDLVFKGGGIKGIALVGALAVLEENGYKALRCAGTSAGGIVAALYMAGYSSSELRKVIAEIDFAKFSDKGWEDRIPGILGEGASLFLDQGIFEGKKLESTFRDLLAAKGIYTFGDLHADDSVDNSYRVQVVVSDITTRRALVLPRDAGELGVEPDDLDVALALRMTSSIPLYFEPVHFKNPKTKQTHILVDGGLLSNFPIWIFDTSSKPRWPTLGLLLVDPAPNTSAPKVPRRSLFDRIGVSETFDYLKAIVETSIESHDLMYLENDDFVRTITISNLGVGTTEFDLPPEKIEALYQSGRAEATKFLETWSFDDYLAKFRPPTVAHSRRASMKKIVADKAT